MKETQKTTMYVAVVCKRDNLGQLVTHPASFTSTDKEALIRRALEYRTTAMRTTPYNHGGALYTVFVGELSQEVTTPVTYSLVELKAL